MSATKMLHRLMSPLRRSSSKKLQVSAPHSPSSPAVKLRLDFTDSNSVVVSLVPGRKATSEAEENGVLLLPDVPEAPPASQPTAGSTSRELASVSGDLSVAAPLGPTIGELSSGAAPSGQLEAQQHTASGTGTANAHSEANGVVELALSEHQPVSSSPAEVAEHVGDRGQSSQTAAAGRQQSSEQSYRGKLQCLLPGLQGKQCMDDQDWWLAVAGEISVLQEGALRAGVHVERLGALEAQVAQLQNVLEVVCAELEAGHKTTHALEKRALAAEGALERANERARAAEDELARQRRTASAPLRQGHSHGTATTGAPPGSPQADHERAHQIGALYAELVGDAERARRGRQMQPNGTKLALTRLSPSKGIHKSLPGSPQSARSGRSAGTMSPFASASPHLRTYNSFSAATLQNLSSPRSQPDTYSMYAASTDASSQHALAVFRQGSAPIMGSAQKAALRQTYGADSHFEAIKDSYFNGAGGQDDLTDRDKTHRWLRGIMSSKSVVDADPKHVDKLVRQLQSLCLQHGINLPLKRTGPCQYSLGSSRMSLKTINGKLMVRCGGGYEHILSAVEKLPVPLHS